MWKLQTCSYPPTEAKCVLPAIYYEIINSSAEWLSISALSRPTWKREDTNITEVRDPRQLRSLALLLSTWNSASEMHIFIQSLHLDILSMRHCQCKETCPSMSRRYSTRQTESKSYHEAIHQRNVYQLKISPSRRTRKREKFFTVTY